MATDITIGGTSITYRDFSITVPTSPVDVAPSAEVTATKNANVSANDTLTITIDGTTVFEGRTRSGGTISELGGLQVEAAHQARDVFEDTVSLSLTTPTTEQVLSAALSNADGGSNLTLSYSGTAVTLDNDYNVTDRPVKRVFRDMMDRTGRVWWVAPGGTTVYVQPLGGRGTWKTIDTQADRATLERFDTGSVDTVRNAVTVVGTGEEQVRATVEDSTSISTYGRRPGNSPYNVAYVTTQSEAQALASELIITDPQPEGDLLVGSNVGNVTQPLANYEVDVLDSGKNINADNLVVEQQTIEQGRADLSLGAGVGVSVEEINRQTKSQNDQNEPGSVYGNDRLADDSVDSEQLREFAVDSFSLDDGAVQSIKLADGSVLTKKLDDLAVEETKINDTSVSTPKLQSGAVIADKIETSTITGTEFDRVVDGEVVDTQNIISLLADKVVFADTGDTVDGTTTTENGTTVIKGGKIETNSITANQIDTLNLSTDELSIGTDADELILAETATDENGFFSTTLRPSSDGAGQLGAPNYYWSAVRGDRILGGRVAATELDLLDSSRLTVDIAYRNDAYDSGNIRIEPTGENTDLGSPFLEWSTIYVDTVDTNLLAGSFEVESLSATYNWNFEDDGANSPTFYAESDGYGKVGLGTNRLFEVHTLNLFEGSPEPLAASDPRGNTSPATDAVDGVDLSTFRESSWGDPPDYARRRHKGPGEGWEHAEDANGLELSHVVNYVWEAAKEIEAERQALAERVDDLEKRLSRLEDKV